MRRSLGELAFARGRACLNGSSGQSRPIGKELGRTNICGATDCLEHHGQGDKGAGVSVGALYQVSQGLQAVYVVTNKPYSQGFVASAPRAELRKVTCSAS